MPQLEKEQVQYFPNRLVRSPRKGQKRVAREPLKEGGVYRFVHGHLEFIEQTEVPKIDISVNRSYRSRDGREVRIYAVNKESIDFPILGAIKEKTEWLPRVYNQLGICKVPYGPGNDIVGDWSDV